MLKLRPPESKRAESGVADTLRILLSRTLPNSDFSRLENTQLITMVSMFWFQQSLPTLHALPNEARKIWQLLNYPDKCEVGRIFIYLEHRGHIKHTSRK